MQRLADPLQMRAGSEAAIAVGDDPQRHFVAALRHGEFVAAAVGEAWLRSGYRVVVERKDAGFVQFDVHAPAAGLGGRGQS